MKKPLFRRLLPLIIVAAGVALAGAMISSRADLPRREDVKSAPQVEVMTIAPETLTVKIRSQGTVTAKQEIDLVSEVSGRVISVAAEFVSGGQVAAGAVLLQIDPIDYEVAIVEAQAAVASAKLRLSEVKVVLMRAAVEEAEAGVAAAEARLRRANADLANTRITAPFDAIIDTKHVDLGQYVTAGLPLMRLLGTDIAEVRLPILASDMRFLQSKPSGDGSLADVVFTASRGTVESKWSGRVVRLERRVDNQTRVFHLVAQIEEPYNPSRYTQPFSVGLFVDASIDGVTLADAIRIPRSAAHGTFVYVVENNQLRKREVEILRREQDSLIVEAGLAAGNVLVLSRLGLMLEGTEVTLASESGL